MKTLMLIIALSLAGSTLAVNDTISDTIEIHSMKQIDDHLVIQDTIIIEHLISKVEKQIKEVDKSNHAIEILVVILVTLSLVNHYIKRKRNG